MGATNYWGIGLSSNNNKQKIDLLLYFLLV